MRHFCWVFALLFLTGCEGMFEKTVKDICEEEPQLCSDLNPDGWCRAEKAVIINKRYQHLQPYTEKDLYILLVGFENYKKCVSKAAQIEHIKLREKETGRMRGLLTANRELKRLAIETKDSKDPYLLYYHWSRFGNQKALDTLLSYEGTKKLDEPDLQIALASYYVKFDLDSALFKLLHALELYKQDAEIDKEVFRSISTIYLKQDNLSMAYLWGAVGEDFEVTDLNLSQLEIQLIKQGIDVATLKKRADWVAEQIQQGTFSSRKY